MDAGLIDRIENSARRGASVLFAGAVGYAAYGYLGTTGLNAQLGLFASGAGALAYLPCSRLLARGRAAGARFDLPSFEIADFDFEEPGELLLTQPLTADELVLTDADRVDAPLDLDDVLAEMSPDSRVVRLFDRGAMPAPRPTAGELRSRVEAHLGDGARPSAPSSGHAPADASEALSQALAELRRSLG